MKGKIYIHRNKLNGKCYVGQTVQSPKVRWGNGHGYSKQVKFYNAIQKYGWNNFDHIILPAVYKTKEALDKAEIEIIQDMDSIDNGYNVSLGGQTGSNNQQYIDSISKEVSQYDMEGNLVCTYKSLRDVERQHGYNHSNIQKCANGKTNSVYGYIWRFSKEPKIPLDSFTYGSSIRINQYDKNDNLINTYISSYEASRQTNIAFQNINKVCKGHRKTAGGYKWSHA